MVASSSLLRALGAERNLKISRRRCRQKQTNKSREVDWIRSEGDAAAADDIDADVICYTLFSSLFLLPFSSRLKGGARNIGAGNDTRSGRPWDQRAAGASWPLLLRLHRPSCNPSRRRPDCRLH